MLRSEIFIPASRRNTAYVIVILLFAVLVGKFYYLQIYQHEKYREMAEYNRIRLVSTNAPRGLILDRHGKILAANRSAYTISVISAEMNPKEAVLNTLSRYLGISEVEINSSTKKYGRGRFLPARIAREISIEQLSYLEEHKIELPGVIYSEFPIRLYPNRTGPRASHVLGYLREVSDEELQKHRDQDYSPGDFIGAQGIEKQYEPLLKGSKGHLLYQVDALGREVGLVKDRSPIPAVPGQDIQLTIDADLQAYAESLLDGIIGAAVVLDAHSGAVLAMVSKPDYSLEDFAGFMQTDQWRRYLTDPDRPLLNRATMGLYPAGSAMKIVTAVAALEHDLVDPNWTIECTGSYRYGDRVFGCWKAHGTVNLSRAVIESCNIYFYQLAQRMDLDQWHHYAAGLGFGQKTGIDLPEEYSGIAPDREFMQKKYGKQGWTKGFLLNVSIGQGDVLVTPLQMARYAAILATRGASIQPWLVTQPVTSKGEAEKNSVRLKRSTWKTIHKLMYDVVNSSKGTAYSSRILDSSVKFYGKTGTAENPHGAPHAWFIGFATQGDQTVSISVLVEHGGHGGSTAAPIAGKIIQKFFEIGSATLTLK